MTLIRFSSRTVKIIFLPYLFLWFLALIQKFIDLAFIINDGLPPTRAQIIFNQILNVNEYAFPVMALLVFVLSLIGLFAKPVPKFVIFVFIFNLILVASIIF